MKAIILSAGTEEKLKPITTTRSKSLIKICGKPLLEHTINNLTEIGINEINIVIGQEKESIVDYFGDGDNLNIKINYIRQENYNSVGKAIFETKSYFSKGDYFVVIYGDVIYSNNPCIPLINTFYSNKTSTASITLAKENINYGNVYLDDNGKITQIIEKPKDKSMSNYVLCGAFILSYDIFDILENNDYNIISSLNYLAKNRTLNASIIEYGWVDLRYPWDILEANKLVLNLYEYSVISKKAEIGDNVTIKGVVRIEDNVVIKSGTTIEGPTYIGKGSFIGNHALIRSYTSINDNSIIGYGVEIKNSVLFDKVKIGRLSFIGDSVIGANVDIGSSVTIVNRNIELKNILVKIDGEIIDTNLNKLGVFIGDNCVIGNNNTIKEGSIIDTNSKINHNYSCY